MKIELFDKTNDQVSISGDVLVVKKDTFELLVKITDVPPEATVNVELTQRETPFLRFRGSSNAPKKSGPLFTRSSTRVCKYKLEISPFAKSELLVEALVGTETKASQSCQLVPQKYERLVIAVFFGTGVLLMVCNGYLFNARFGIVSNSVIDIAWRFITALGVPLGTLAGATAIDWLIQHVGAATTRAKEKGLPKVLLRFPFATTMGILLLLGLLPRLTLTMVCNQTGGKPKLEFPGELAPSSTKDPTCVAFGPGVKPKLEEGQPFQLNRKTNTPFLNAEQWNIECTKKWGDCELSFGNDCQPAEVQNCVNDFNAAPTKDPKPFAGLVIWHSAGQKIEYSAPSGTVLEVSFLHGERRLLESVEVKATKVGGKATSTTTGFSLDGRDEVYFGGLAGAELFEVIPKPDFVTIRIPGELMKSAEVKLGDGRCGTTSSPPDAISGRVKFKGKLLKLYMGACKFSFAGEEKEHWGLFPDVPPSSWQLDVDEDVATGASMTLSPDRLSQRNITVVIPQLARTTMGTVVCGTGANELRLLDAEVIKGADQVTTKDGFSYQREYGRRVWWCSQSTEGFYKVNRETKCVKVSGDKLVECGVVQDRCCEACSDKTVNPDNWAKGKSCSQNRPVLPWVTKSCEKVFQNEAVCKKK